MPRAIRVLDARDRGSRAVIDTVLLDFEKRSAGKVSVAGVDGTAIDIDLPAGTRLRTDDHLLLDNGNVVEVVAAPEALIEARAADQLGLMRLAWHLGDRHLPVQVLNNRIRVRCDSSVEALLLSLGAKLTSLDAPFEPEGGAYASAHAYGHHHHEHGHEHHDQAHHHDHVHGHGHRHKH
jgi:urease accessory protein